MNIGLPGRCKHHMQIVRDERPKNTHIAGSRNLNDIRAEILYHLQKPLIMPREQKVEFVMSIERKFKRAAAQLNSRQRSVNYNFVRRPGVNQKKWNAALP